MARTPPQFEIHVDPSCLSEDFEKENTILPEQATSNETTVHHDSWSETEIKDAQQTAEGADEHANEVNDDDVQTKEDEARERRIEKIQAEIRTAAERVVASIEQDNFDKEDSVLSTRTDDCDQESEFIHEEGTEIRYGEETEMSYESEHGSHSGHISEGAGDSSSHHDGDIDDDVFSSSNRSSARSSINSISDLQDIDENQKLLTSPAVGEDAASGSEHEIISRVPSASSYIRSGVDEDRTPSKVMTRPPFRTPSSVRAMQMSSPTQSMFSSPRSAKRHMPTVSRLGTPTTHSSPTKRTPTRFKVKKEYPLILLHVTVLPLQWKYSHAMNAEVPESLKNIRDSWKLLQNKLGDTVLERGVLLAHPQDSYEVLEERLLEALELPVRPRAKILKCGHYMGPTDSDVQSSDEELGESWAVEKREDRNWCDVCRRSVRLEDIGVADLDKRFVIKIYASNGLMRAGAWAAAWREMERVDVEIEPFIEVDLHAELEHLALITPMEEPVEKRQEEDDGFVDEDMMIEHVHDHEQEDQERREAEILLREEEVRSRMAEEEEMRQRMADDENLRQLRIVEEEEKKLRLEEEERQRLEEEEAEKQRLEAEEEKQRLEEEKNKLEEEEKQRLEEEERQKSSQMVQVEQLQQLKIVGIEEMKQRIEDEERQKISLMVSTEHMRQLRIVEEEEMKRRLEDEERQKISQMAEELGIRHRMDRDNDLRRKMAEEERMRNIYGHPNPNSTHDERHEMARQNSPRNAVRGDESLSELLFAAFKVAMRDSKNVTILLLSVFVLFLALRPTSSVHSPTPIVIGESPSVVQITTTVFTEVVPTSTHVTESVTIDAPAALEASAVIITETVAAPPVTTIIIQEKTVTEMVPAPSMPTEAAPELLEAETESALPVVEDIASTAEEEVALSMSSPDATSIEEEEAVPTASSSDAINMEEEEVVLTASSPDATSIEQELPAEVEAQSILSASSIDVTETEQEMGSENEEGPTLDACSTDDDTTEEEPSISESSTDTSAAEEQSVLPTASADAAEAAEDLSADSEGEIPLCESSTDTAETEEDLEAVVEEQALPLSVTEEEVVAPLAQEVETPLVPEEPPLVVEEAIKEVRRPCVRKPLARESIPQESQSQRVAKQENDI